MPLPVLSDEERKAALTASRSDLSYLLDDHAIPMEVQLAVYHSGFVSIPLFASIDSTEEGVRTFLRNEWDLNPAATLEHRKVVALILLAWEAARNKKVEEAKLSAAAKVSGITPTLKIADYAAMKKAYERQFGKMAKKDSSSKDLVTLRLSQIEDDEPLADDLIDVTCEEDLTSEFIDTNLTTDGRLQIKRGAKAKGQVPKDPEMLRYLHKIIGSSWLFAKTKISNKAWLAELDENTFVHFSNYVLGTKVWGISKGIGRGNVPPPDWSTVLKYEFEMRRKAMDLVIYQGDGESKTEVVTIAGAMLAVTKDTELRQLHFLTPMQFEGNPAAASVSGQQLVPRQPQQPLFDQHVKRGRDDNNFTPQKGQGRGQGGKQPLGKTPDGRLICYAFNNEGQNCPGSCNMLHICLRCQNKGHPAFSCTVKPVGKNKGGKRGGRGNKGQRGKNQARTPGDTLAGLDEVVDQDRRERGLPVLRDQDESDDSGASLAPVRRRAEDHNRGGRRRHY